MKQPQGKEITGSKTGTQRKKEGQSKQKGGRDASDKKASAAKEHRSSKSDHLVSRMKNFLQGGENQRSYNISHNSKAAEARRKRGGSVDNLIDSVEANPSLGSITTDTKKKMLEHQEPLLHARQGGEEGTEGGENHQRLNQNCHFWTLFTCDSQAAYL